MFKEKIDYETRAEDSPAGFMKWLAGIALAGMGVSAVWKNGYLADVSPRTAYIACAAGLLAAVLLVSYGMKKLIRNTLGLLIKAVLAIAIMLGIGIGAFALLSPEAEPFAVMVCGNDQEGEVSEYGRTDVNIIAAVNPETAQVALVSLPRDLFIPNPELDWYEDKLTHLGNHGIENTRYGVSCWLEENIEHYALVNFTAFTELIDAIGGVTIDNPYEFTYSWEPEITFEEGKIHLTGEEALLYVRERYNLVNGDFDRNEHQQIVLKAVIKKMMSIRGIMAVPSLLRVAEEAIITDADTKTILLSAGRMLLHIKDLNMITASAEGYTSYEYCASDPFTPLSVVWPDEESAYEAAQLIKEIKSGEYPEE